MEITQEDRVHRHVAASIYGKFGDYHNARRLALGDDCDADFILQALREAANQALKTSEQAVLAKLRDLPRDIALRVSSEVQKSVSALLFADNIKTIASALADALEQKP